MHLQIACVPCIAPASIPEACSGRLPIPGAQAAVLQGCTRLPAGLLACCKMVYEGQLRFWLVVVSLVLLLLRVLLLMLLLLLLLCGRW
jgi:hypothetical protein